MGTGNDWFKFWQSSIESDEYNDYCDRADGWIIRGYEAFKYFRGTSTRPLKKRRPTNEKKTMETEAKNVALKEFFKDSFGITEFNDILVDELHRRIDVSWT